MTSRLELEERFSGIGARFCISVDALSERLAGVRALLFDWDGVFNSGAKGSGAASGFNEADSMGLNLWRYAIWRRHGRLPFTAVITGENNESALAFCEREHFDAVYTGVLDKSRVVADVLANKALEKREVACVFDDINDLGMAAACGVRFIVRREASALLRDYAIEHELADYVTAARCGDYALREIAELALGLCGDFDAVVGSRLAFDESYAEYFTARQAAETAIFRGLGR